MVVSSADGYYSFPLLVSGIYEVSVVKEGFQKQNRTGIKVDIGEVRQEGEKGSRLRATCPQKSGWIFLPRTEN